MAADSQTASNARPHAGLTAASRRPPVVAPAEVRRDEPHPSAESPRHHISQVLVATELVTVGRWRCPVDSPFFRDSGPPGVHLCVFPRTGVWIRQDGCRPFVADPTVVTFYNRGQHYLREPIDRRGDCCEWFGLSDDVQGEILRAHDCATDDRDRVGFAFTHGPSDRTTYLDQRAVYEHACRAIAPDVLFIEETTMDVVSRVVRLAIGSTARPVAAATPTTRRRAADLAEVARAVLAIGYAEPWPLAEVARRAGASAFHLARVFRTHTGRSLHEYRTELRMRAALERLADPSTTGLMDLALALGYSSHSHLTAVFKRTFGLTPSEYRGGRRPALVGVRAIS